MVDFGQNRKAKRYALEICQWLDGILKDDSVEESIEYEMNNTVEGLSRQVVDLKKRNKEYKKDLDDLNSRVSEMSEYLALKSKLQEVSSHFEEYRSDSEKRIFQTEKSNQKLQDEKIRVELKCRGLEENNRELAARNEDLMRKLDDKTRELELKTVERIELEERHSQREQDLKLQLEDRRLESQRLETHTLKLEERLRCQKEELQQQLSKDLAERELKIQGLTEECKHNKYRITELEKLLKMAEDEQLVSKNYRSLIEQYKNRLQILEGSEKAYLELQERWAAQEKLLKQQSQKLEQAEGWLKRLVELEQENSALSQNIKQWETMALRYTHNLKVFNRDGSSSAKDLSEETTDYRIESGESGFQGDIVDEKVVSNDAFQEKKSISPTSVLSAIFEFQRRYQDVLVSKTIIESSKAELENKVDILESRLQVCERESKFYEEELTSKSNEIQAALESNKRLECEIKVLKECLSKESRTRFGSQSQDENDISASGVAYSKEGPLSASPQKEGEKPLENCQDLIDSRAGKKSRESLIEAHRLDLEEKTKIITHLESELRLRNEEIKTYWSIRVAYDTLVQERDSLLETSNSLQGHNTELKSQIITLNEKIKFLESSPEKLRLSPRSAGSPRVGRETSKRGQDTVVEGDKLPNSGVLGQPDERECPDSDLTDSWFKEKYLEEQRRSQILNEYYIKERSNLVDAISNILGWRIEIIYVEGGLTAYKLSNIFSSHGGELIFVIRPAPSMEGGGGSITNNPNAASNAVTTTFLLTSDNLISETEPEEQLTLDFIGYYANKFEEDSNWALQLTATQSYPAFMAYTCLEEFHTSNIQATPEDQRNQPGDSNNARLESDSPRRKQDIPQREAESDLLATKTKRLREDTSWIRHKDS